MQPNAQIVGKAARPTTHTSRKGMRGFLGDNIKEDDISVVQEVLPKRSRKEQVLVARSTATKKASTSKAGNEEKYEGDDHAKDEKHFDKKQTDVLPSGNKKQVRFDEVMLAEEKRNEWNLVPYCDSNLVLQPKSMATYSKA